MSDATHPLAAAVPQQEANLSAVQQPRCPVCLASFPCQHSLTSTTAGWATAPQVSPPQARVPLTEAQALAANPYINDPARQALWLAAIRFTERYHGIQLSEGERSHD